MILSRVNSELLPDEVHDFSYEVNEYGHVLEVMTRRSDGHRVSESMVYGLDSDAPYTRWHGDRYYLPEDGVRGAREAREAYRMHRRGRSVPGWGWEVD